MDSLSDERRLADLIEEAILNCERCECGYSEETDKAADVLRALRARWAGAEATRERQRARIVELEAALRFYAPLEANGRTARVALRAALLEDEAE